MVFKMSIESIEKLVDEIRTEFRYSRGVAPVIVDVIERNSTDLHVIVSDRAEKSLMIGPRGIIAAEIAKRTDRKVSFYGADEILIRNHRLGLSLKRIDELIDQVNRKQKEVITMIGDLVKLERDYPATSMFELDYVSRNANLGIAYSGGYDSTGALLIVRKLFPRLKAFTVNLGPRFIDPREIERMHEQLKELGVTFFLIEDKAEFSAILDKMQEGKSHPCRLCHEVTMECVKKAAIEERIDVLITGELLPTGRQSMEYEKGLLTIHLPAALALSKYRTKEISSGKRNTNITRFGCAHLANLHRRGWRDCGPSIFRVLRELQAGILSSGEALKLIKSILLPLLRDRKIQSSESLERIT